MQSPRHQYYRNRIYQQMQQPSEQRKKRRLSNKEMAFRRLVSDATRRPSSRGTNQQVPDMKRASTTTTTKPHETARRSSGVLPQAPAIQPSPPSLRHRRQRLKTIDLPPIALSPSVEAVQGDEEPQQSSNLQRTDRPHRSSTTQRRHTRDRSLQLERPPSTPAYWWLPSPARAEEDRDEEMSYELLRGEFPLLASAYAVPRAVEGDSEGNREGEVGANRSEKAKGRGFWRRGWGSREFGGAR